MAREGTPVEGQTCEEFHDTAGRHFGIEDEPSTGIFELYLLMGDKKGPQKKSSYSVTGTKEKGGGGELMSAHVYLSLRFALGLLLLIESVLLALTRQAIREAFVNQLRACVMEHSSGSILTGIRAFSIYLPVIPPPLCSPPILFVYFQVKNGFWYFLDYAQDSGGGSLCPLIPQPYYPRDCNLCLCLLKPL